MRLLRGIALALVLAGPSAAQAEAPDTSLRPEPRTAEAAETAETGTTRTTVTTASAPARSPRPSPRPIQAPASVTLASAASAAAATVAVPEPPRDPIGAFISSLTTPRAAAAAVAPVATLPGVSALAVTQSLRPEPRPGGLRLVVAVPNAPRPTSSRGSICGVNEIKGQTISDINGPGRCGVHGAVRVASVAGIELSMQPTIDCTTAKALNTWVKNGVLPAIGRKGGGVARINIIAHYACRTRNNVRGAKLSEHALGHAVDVAGVTLRDGTKVTVEHDWNSRRFGKIVQAMWKAACGPFGTVLGPRADRYHYNHFHVDTARYRGGPYCR